MANILNYLKIAYQDIKQESSQNLYFGSLLLVLLTIPLGYAINNIALGLFLASVFFQFKKQNFIFDKALLLPVILYFLMVLSLFWSISFDRTLKALPKEISLFLVPVAFICLNFTKSVKEKILKYYSFGILAYAIYYLIKAIIRFLITQDSNVFFYHELVTKDLNAIHVSVYFSVAFFYFLTQKIKTTFIVFALFIIGLVILLLSSKNIIIVFLALVITYYLFYIDISKKARRNILMVFCIAILSLGFIGKVRERFANEFKANVENSIADNVKTENKGLVYNVTIKQAWENENFRPNDFFSGAAFRIYQLRIFKEFLQEDDIFLTGYGLNASYKKINEKAQKYNLFRGDKINAGYQEKNFHNQYVQNFAELGIFGFLILIVIVAVNLKNSIKSKDFLHIAFSILMISLFLTESFLWRQRGVMFFTLMYCIFNARENVNLTKTE